MMKTICDETGCHDVPMTPEEIAERLAEEQAAIAAEAAEAMNTARREALAVKWPDSFALLDDILERGIEAVKEERETIKLANPKGD